MAISVQEAQERFSEAGIQRSDRYADGTRGKGSSWEGAKARAKTNFAPAMQEALSKKLYETGLDSAGASDYDNGIRDKGIANWGVGLQAGKDKYGKRIQKFSSLWSSPLPTVKGPRRSAANLKRMTENVARFVQTAGK